MKFSIVLVTLFCASTINAAAIKEPSPFVQNIVNFTEGIVMNLEKVIPGWDASASLEKNVIVLVDKPLESGLIPGWNPNASVRDNLINSVEFQLDQLPKIFKNFDEKKSLSGNINIIVTDFLDILPFPSFIPKGLIKDIVAGNIIRVLQNIKIADFDVDYSVRDDAVAWIDASIATAQIVDPKATPEEFINDIIKASLDLVKLPGYSPSKTLEENVADVIISIFSFFSL